MGDAMASSAVGPCSQSIQLAAFREAIVDMLSTLGKQRLGRLHNPLEFSTDILRNESLVGRLARQHSLDAHNGCVNTVEWSEQGNLLLSGSDDHCITLWRWPEGEHSRTKQPCRHRKIL